MKYPVFENKKEKIDFLVKNQKDIVAFKKAALKHSDCFGKSLFEKNLSIDIDKNTSDSLEFTDTEDTIYRTIVANTYKWLDSHDDVHIPGIFTKTLQENQGNIYHLHDHLFQVDAKVGTPQKVYEQQIPWSSLGVNLAGSTTVLLADSAIKKGLNAQVFDQYLTKEIKQHSVAMMYVNLFLCVNDPDYKDQFAAWNQYSVGIGNIDKAIEQGYFWAITEAKLKEFSCVLQGSNELTPVLEQKEQPSEDTEHKQEPPLALNNFKYNPNLH